jgi:hypothetical protein
MLGALIICAGIFVALYALSLVLPDNEPDGTTRPGLRRKR